MSYSEVGESAYQNSLDLPTGLTQESLVDIHATMTLVRLLDERVWMMNRQGKAAIVASCQGHEAAQIGSVWALRDHTLDQFFFTYYRDMAVLVAQGLTPLDVMLGYLAKTGEPLSGARQFPMHGASLERKVMNLSNVVGAHVTEAVGWALACKLKGLPTVVAVYFGDGATSQGDVHEAMNFAAIHSLPVLFLCENNKYAISVPLGKQMAISKISTRAAGYGMPGVTVDGTDVLAVYQATAEAAVRAASNHGPSLIEFDVERYLPHTSDDDDAMYRSRDEVEQARKRDPLIRLRGLLLGSGALSEESVKVCLDRAMEEVDKATSESEAAPYPPIDDFFTHVYDRAEGEG